MLVLHADHHFWLSIEYRNIHLFFSGPKKTSPQQWLVKATDETWCGWGAADVTQPHRRYKLSKIDQSVLYGMQNEQIIDDMQMASKRRRGEVSLLKRLHGEVLHKGDFFGTVYRRNVLKH